MDNHNKTLVAEDEDQDLAVEHCSCGQYALSVGAVTIQVEGETLVALTRMLLGVVGDPDAAQINTPFTPDVQ